MKPAFGTLASGNFKQHARYRGCVLHYAMSEGGGITLYNVAQGTSDGILSLGPSWTSGQFGHCINLDGTDDTINLGLSTNLDFPNQTFSVCWWTKTSTLPGGSSYYICKRVAVGGPVQGGYFARLDSAGTLTARIVDANNTSAAARTSTSTTLADGTWKFITMLFKTDTVTLANNDLSIYINARLDQGSRTDSAFGPYNVAALALTFGNTSDSGVGTFYTGLVDELRIYNRELTYTEILSLYLDPYLEFIPRKSYLTSAEVVAGASAVNRMRMGVGA